VDGPSATVSFREAAHLAVDNPKIGRAVREFELEDVREIIMGTHRIVYCIRPDAILVLTVIEGHQLMPLTVAAKTKY